MDEVAKARERRTANLAGEGERRAEAEKRRSQFFASSTARQSQYHSASSSQLRDAARGPIASRPSQIALDAHARLPSLQVHPASPPEIPSSRPGRAQGRSQSYYDSLPRNRFHSTRPETTRQSSTPSSGSASGSGSSPRHNGLEASRRYHSFYAASPHHSPAPARHHASLPPNGAVHMGMPMSMSIPHGMGHMGMYPQPFLAPGMPHPNMGMPMGYPMGNGIYLPHSQSGMPVMPGMLGVPVGHGSMSRRRAPA